MATITHDSLFLVSGGGRGITARCAVAMAEAFRCGFLLLGRTPQSGEPAWAAGLSDEAALKKSAMAAVIAQGEKPTPTAIGRQVSAVLANREIAQTVAAIEAAGGRARYISADIGRADALRTALEAARDMGTITGIVHGAGALADKRIEQKTEADFESVYAAKVGGLENLLAAVSAETLDALVLFSSVAGFYGNPGQADYAIANEILNKTAHSLKQRYPAVHVVSICWGPWDGGMVTPTLRGYFDQLGIQVIPVDVGARILVDELSRPAEDAPVQTIVGSAIRPLPAPPPQALVTHRVRRSLLLRDNPFLGDHVVNGQAVLPMVSAMVWMANTCEGLYPGYHFFGFERYRVLKGIVFEDAFTNAAALELKEVSRTPDRIVVDALIRSDSREGKPRFHYDAQLTLHARREPVPTTTLPDPITGRTFTGEALYGDGTLFHGWSFQGIEQVLGLHEDGLVMRCVLPTVDRAYQGQFPIQAFNYFMVDIGLQAIGVWARKTYDMGSLPLRAAKGEFWGNATFGQTFYVTMEVASHTDTNVTATITLYDEHQRIFARISDLEVTMSSRLNSMFLNNRLPQPIDR
jgi:NADP-dependent 3-hydroxy acid dehydrogenase YdfG